jgi:hypothetical protein
MADRRTPPSELLLSQIGRVECGWLKSECLLVIAFLTVQHLPHGLSLMQIGCGDRLFVDDFLVLNYFQDWLIVGTKSNRVMLLVSSPNCRPTISVRIRRKYLVALRVERQKS